jgi:predicted DNA-binding transcriptional regulator YafY
MSFLKYLQRLERIDYLIRRKATGTPEEFAIQMNLSRSALMEYIREMKEIGAPIVYCRQRQSYYYKEEKQLLSSD